MAKSKLDSWFARTWLRRGPAACLLWPLSLLFGALAGLRRTLYRFGILKSERIAVPVIVVGNIFVGGTGKTPLTIWLVEALRHAGYRPGVVSRGHGVSAEMPRTVTSTSLPEQVGDEPLLVVQRTGCPLMVGRRRADAARALLSLYPEIDVLISDDGLQHYAMQRDIEIILFDARGAGNGWLLPAGPLREPVSRRRDFTVINAMQRRNDWPAGAIQMQLIGLKAYSLGDRAKQISLAALSVPSDAENPAGRIVAAAGIGNPERFFLMLRAAGLDFDTMPLADHFDYVSTTFDDVQADVILITEKDAVKCLHIAALREDPRMWVVPVTAHLDGALAELIVEKLRGYPTA